MPVSLFNELNEIYLSRSILRSLIVKNLFGRYKNSALGFAWHFVIPTVMMIVYYLVFTQIRTNPIPNYWIYLSSGLFPFTFMISNLAGGAASIVSNSGMVKKIYFPRSILVLAQIMSSFITTMIGYFVVLIVIYIFGQKITMSIVMLPVVLVLIFLFTLGYSLFFSALTVYSRDVQYVLSAITIVFYFLTPMYFSLDDISGILNIIVHLNPFTYYIDALHVIVYGSSLPSIHTIGACILLSVISMVIGILVFRNLRNGFAERL